MKNKSDQTVKRHRRNNLELARLSRSHLRLIQRTAEEVQAPLEGVLADIVEIGVAGVLASYSAMIKAREEMEQERKTRTERIRNLFSDEQNSSETTGSGSATEQAEMVNVEHVTGTNSGPYPGIAADETSPTLDRSTDLVIGPGYQAQTGTVIGSIDPDGAITIE